MKGVAKVSPAELLVNVSICSVADGGACSSTGGRVTCCVVLSVSPVAGSLVGVGNESVHELLKQSDGSVCVM